MWTPQRLHLVAVQWFVLGIVLVSAVVAHAPQTACEPAAHPTRTHSRSTTTPSSHRIVLWPHGPATKQRHVFVLGLPVWSRYATLQAMALTLAQRGHTVSYIVHTPGWCARLCATAAAAAGVRGRVSCGVRWRAADCRAMADETNTHRRHSPPDGERVLRRLCTDADVTGGGNDDVSAPAAHTDDTRRRCGEPPSGEDVDTPSSSSSSSLPSSSVPSSSSRCLHTARLREAAAHPLPARPVWRRWLHRVSSWILPWFSTTTSQRTTTAHTTAAELATLVRQELCRRDATHVLGGASLRG